MKNTRVRAIGLTFLTFLFFWLIISSFLSSILYAEIEKRQKKTTLLHVMSF